VDDRERQRRKRQQSNRASDPRPQTVTGYALPGPAVDIFSEDYDPEADPNRTYRSRRRGNRRNRERRDLAAE
jgi:hypothetical protein